MGAQSMSRRDISWSGRDGLHPGSSWIHGGRLGSYGSAAVLHRIRLDRGGIGSDADELSRCDAGRGRRASHA